jgi:uncharacterized membrane protein YbhN (UPF0104 family)
MQITDYILLPALAIPIFILSFMGSFYLRRRELAKSSTYAPPRDMVKNFVYLLFNGLVFAFLLYSVFVSGSSEFILQYGLGTVGMVCGALNFEALGESTARTLHNRKYEKTDE